jgi:hypothetical protein
MKRRMGWSFAGRGEEMGRGGVWRFRARRACLLAGFRFARLWRTGDVAYITETLVTPHIVAVEKEATYNPLSRRSCSSASVILARSRGACTGDSGLMELESSESHTGALSGAGAGLVVGLTASGSGSGELASDTMVG